MGSTLKLWAKINQWGWSPSTRKGSHPNTCHKLNWCIPLTIWLSCYVCDKVLTGSNSPCNLELALELRSCHPSPSAGMRGMGQPPSEGTPSTDTQRYKAFYQPSPLQPDNCPKWKRKLRSRPCPERWPPPLSVLSSTLMFLPCLGSCSPLFLILFRLLMQRMG